MTSVVLLSFLLLAPCTLSLQPHLVFVFVDDFGFNNIGIHASTQANSAEVLTPNLNNLAHEGIILDRHYTFKFCSPSRSAFHTGRNPIHVNVLNDNYFDFNASNPESGAQGIPRNMSTVAQKLADANYNTVAAGKWHCGCASPGHLPRGRGYKKSLVRGRGSATRARARRGCGSTSTHMSHPTHPLSLFFFPARRFTWTVPTATGILALALSRAGR